MHPAVALHAAAASWNHLEWEHCAAVQELDDFCKKSKSDADKEQKKVGKLVCMSWMSQPYFCCRQHV